MSRDTEFRRLILMQQAARLLQKEGLLKLPVNIEGLAKTRDIDIEPMKSRRTGVSGILVRHGNKFGILYDASIPNQGYQRFSIAHELGHFFIDGHVDHIPFNNGYHRSRANFMSDNCYEREADYFASGLLMPTKLVRPLMLREPDGLNAIEAIQKCTRASLTASAIRYSEIAEVAAAVIVSRVGGIDYCFMSNALKALKGLQWIRKGTPVPPGTVTAAMMEETNAQPQDVCSVDEVDIVEWFGGELSIQMQEEVVELGSYGRFLTVLTCSDLVDEGFMDQDEESDEVLEESWKPRFRR